MFKRTEKTQYLRRKTNKNKRTNGTQKRRRTNKRNKNMPQQTFERFFRYRTDQPTSRTEPMSRFYR